MNVTNFPNYFTSNLNSVDMFAKEIDEWHLVLFHFAMINFLVLLLIWLHSLCFGFFWVGSHGTFNFRVNLGTDVCSNFSGIIPSTSILSWAVSSICFMSEEILWGWCCYWQKVASFEPQFPAWFCFLHILEPPNLESSNETHVSISSIRKVDFNLKQV